MFIHGTSKIKISGTEVIPFPLFEVLDGSSTEDYLQRVEPSPQGGKKMAKALMDVILGGRQSEEQPVESSPLVKPTTTI